MTRSKGLLVAVLVLLGLVVGAARGFAQRPGTAEGYWKGTIQNTGAAPAREILVWLNRNPEGAWGGTLDIPKFGVMDFPLIVTGEGRTVTFRYPGGPFGNPTFTGTLSADANRITGNFVEEGKSYRFELTRQPGPPGAAANPAQDKALTHARRVLELLRQEKFADVVKDFSPEATAALPIATLKQRWTTLRTEVGAYKSELSKTVDHLGTITMVTLGCQFERAARNVVIVYTPDEKVASIQFVPRAAAAAAAPQRGR